MAALLTRWGWQWEPSRDQASFLATHQAGRYMLTWEGHYAAVVDGHVDGPIPRLRFLGGWRQPG